MADINQYDSPAQANFINTYSPIPFNELMQAGAMKAKQYDQGIDALAQTYEDTNNLKYIPNSKDEQYIKTVVIPHVKTVVDKYSNEDLSDPIIKRQLRMELNNGVDKQRVKDAQLSHEQWQVNQKIRSEEKRKGTYRASLDSSDNGYDTSTQGIYSKMLSAGVDYNEVATGFFKNIKGYSHINPKTGEVLQVIDRNKIKGIAAANAEDFIKSEAGRQMLSEHYHDNPNDKTNPAQVAYQYLVDKGQRELSTEHRGFVPEWMMKDKEPTTPYGQFYKNERTPVIPVGQQRSVSSKDFDIQQPKVGIVFQDSNVPASQSKGFSNIKELGINQDHDGKPYYDTSVLNKPEVQNIIKLFPKNYRDRFMLIKDDKWIKENPEQAREIQDDLYGKLKNTYTQIEKELQQGSYLESYYPKAIEGIPESRLNNVDNVTNYIFKGSNGDIKKVSSGNFINREFINMKTGESVNGKIFYDTVIKPAQSKNEDGTIAITGEYNSEHPFVAMTNNDNFSKAYQISVNGDQYIMSGEAADYSDPTDNYKKNLNKSYTLTKFNPEIPIDEHDGTLKMYKEVPKIIDGEVVKDDNGNVVKVGMYAVMDKESGELISQSENFTKAYNDGRSYLANKKKK